MEFDPNHTIRDVIVSLEEELKKEEHIPHYIELAQMIDSYLKEIKNEKVNAKLEDDERPISWDVRILRKQVKFLQSLCPIDVRTK